MLFRSRALWPNRPLDIYFYYSDAVGAIPNQGYSLHHATGWYLNFGISGILLGAVVLGGVWAACIRSQSSVEQRLGASKVFAIIAPWLFVAYLPPLIRAGPEGYKGWILEAVLIPVAVLTLSSKPVQNAAIGLHPHTIPGR